VLVPGGTGKLTACMLYSYRMGTGRKLPYVVVALTSVLSRYWYFYLMLYDVAMRAIKEPIATVRVSGLETVMIPYRGNYTVLCFFLTAMPIVTCHTSVTVIAKAKIQLQLMS
jgi:hypothetical protein